MVQKSGYFARSSSPNVDDIKLIHKTAKHAVNCAINKESCVVGLSEKENKIQCISFSEIKGGKKFNINEEWFVSMLKDIGQKY